MALPYDAICWPEMSLPDQGKVEQSRILRHNPTKSRDVARLTLPEALVKGNHPVLATEG